MNLPDNFSRRKVIGFGLFMLFGGVLYFVLAGLGYTVEFFHSLEFPEWMMYGIGGLACLIGLVGTIVGFKMPAPASQRKGPGEGQGV